MRSSEGRLRGGVGLRVPVADASLRRVVSSIASECLATVAKGEGQADEEDSMSLVGLPGRVRLRMLVGRY